MLRHVRESSLATISDYGVVLLARDRCAAGHDPTSCALLMRKEEDNTEYVRDGKPPATGTDKQSLRGEEERT